jgi:hypothetical protein
MSRTRLPELRLWTHQSASLISEYMMLLNDLGDIIRSQEDNTPADQVLKRIEAFDELCDIAEDTLQQVRARVAEEREKLRERDSFAGQESESGHEPGLLTQSTENTSQHGAGMVAETPPS